MQWYVAKSGLDSNVGTQGQPLQTIQAAANRANPGDVVVIRAGVYRETVKPPRDGISFVPFSGETVTVSGADPVSGWVANGPTFRAPLLGDLGVGANQLFVCGKMLPEARWPKPGPDLSRPNVSRIGQIVSVNATQVIFTDPNITQPDGTWNGATLHITTGEEWICTYGTVVSQVGNTLTVNWKCPDTGDFAKTYEWPRAGNRYFMYNTPAAFSAPGEWYINPTLPASQALCIWLAPGIDPNTLAIEQKTRKYGFDLTGRKNILISGLFLFACTIQMDDNCESNNIQSLHGRYLSHYTYYSGWEAPDDSGIVLRGKNNVLSASELHYSAGDGVTVLGYNHTIQHNTITDVNYTAADGAGVRCEWGVGFKVQNNYIKNVGRDHIKCSNVTQGDFGYNRLDVGMLQATDGGGIYAYGTDAQATRIHHNIVTGIHGGGFGGAGVYLDNKSNNYRIDHNLCYDCDHGGKNNSPNTNTIWHKNTFIGTRRAMDADNTSGFTGTVYSNNIFEGPGALLGNEAVKVNNFGQDAVISNIPAGVGAFADGEFTAGPTVAPIFVRNASVVQSALIYDGSFGGIRPVGLDQAKPSGMGYCDYGTWIKYRAVDFSKASSKLTIGAAVNNAFAGQTMEIRLDAPDGQLIGTMVPTGTGPNPENWYSYISQSCPISKASGIRDLYFVFKGNGVCNIQSFIFS